MDALTCLVEHAMTCAAFYTVCHKHIRTRAYHSFLLRLGPPTRAAVLQHLSVNHVCTFVIENGPSKHTSISKHIQQQAACCAYECMPSAEPHADCLCPHNLDRLSHVVNICERCCKPALLVGGPSQRRKTTVCCFDVFVTHNAAHVVACSTKPVEASLYYIAKAIHDLCTLAT